MIRKIIVVGGGSAGFMCALALKKKLPQLRVVVIRSKEIGVIGVGEGSGVPLTMFLHKFLGLPIAQFVKTVKPSWKLGTYFLWGPRERFLFPFGTTLAARLEGMNKAAGYYCTSDMEYASLPSAFMAEGRVFERGADGTPVLQPFAYHIENSVFAEFLEELSAGMGVEIISDTIQSVRQDDQGVSGLELASGKSKSADLYVDCSGFVSLLLGRTLKEPFKSFSSTLFCDRAMVGGWDRGDEPIRPYTIAETMNAGWCWQIEHPDRINRGYVYSSAFISDEEAEREFRAKNPKVTATRIVKFVSGRYERSWVKNVVAIGNASGFIEPLEATALPIIATRSMQLTELLQGCDLDVKPACANMFNGVTARIWDSTRRFLATHYKFNTRLQTPFWRHCQEHTDLAGAEPIVDWYREMGPSPYAAQSLVDPLDIFGIEGYLTTLMGQAVPHRSAFVPSAGEMARWNSVRAANKARAQRGMTVEEMFEEVQKEESAREVLQGAN